MIFAAERGYGKNCIFLEIVEDGNPYHIDRIFFKRKKEKVTKRNK